jgi:heme exporter protein CcmD
MDGYTGYLLVAYSVTALVIVGNLVAARRQFRRTTGRLRQQLERRAGRKPAASGADGEDGNQVPVGRGQ